MKGEDEDESKEEKYKKEEDLARKKGKVDITKPPKSSTIVFTRTSMKKWGSEVLFSKPPPTFQERLKKLEVGTSIENFKALKSKTKTDA